MVEVLEGQVAQGRCSGLMLNLFWKQSEDPMLVYLYGGILMRRGVAAIDSGSPASLPMNLVGRLGFSKDREWEGDSDLGRRPCLVTHNDFPSRM